MPLPDINPNDGWLVVVNGEVMCGVTDKATIRSGKKKSIFAVMIRMNRLAKLCARWLSKWIYIVPERVLNAVFLSSQLWHVSRYQRCYSGRSLADSKGGKCCPGLCQMQRTDCQGQAWKTDEVGRVSMDQLCRYNAPLTMATAGSKGLCYTRTITTTLITTP